MNFNKRRNLMQNENDSLCPLDFKKALERKVKGVGLVPLHYHWL